MAGRTFDELVTKYPARVQALARSARGLILELLPGADQAVDSSGPYVGYGYGPGYTGTICTLILSKQGVKLGLVRGADLADPRRLLAGSGKVHKYVALDAPADLRQPGLRPLIRSAVAAWRDRDRRNRQ